MNRRPIVHDSQFPITGGSRDRRRGGWDSDPSTMRPRLEAHLRTSMGAQNYATAIDLLDAYINSWLGLGGEGEGEGEGGAMDARVRDHGARSLAELFPDARAPLKLEGGETASGDLDARVLDHRPGELAKMFPDLKAPMRV